MRVQPVPRHILEPVQLNAPRLEVRSECLLEPLALAVDVERREAARRRDHAEHAQRGRRSRGPPRRAGGHVSARAAPCGRGSAASRDRRAPPTAAPQGRERSAAGRSARSCRARRRRPCSCGRRCATVPVNADSKSMRPTSWTAASVSDMTRRAATDDSSTLASSSGRRSTSVVEVERDRLGRLTAADRPQHAHDVGARLGSGPDLQLHHGSVHLRTLSRRAATCNRGCPAATTPAEAEVAVLERLPAHARRRRHRVRRLRRPAGSGTTSVAGDVVACGLSLILDFRGGILRVGLDRFDAIRGGFLDRRRGLLHGLLQVLADLLRGIRHRRRPAAAPGP